MKPELIAPSNANAPLILYIDANKRLQVGTWVTTNNGQVTSNNILQTHGGSTIAFTMTNNSDGWGAGDIKFNPTSLLNATWENNGTAGYTSIPSWNTWPGSKPSSYSVTANADFISKSPYHTLKNVKAGFGDICQLVGYTQEAVAEMSELPPPTYRLPTNPENSTFIGYPGIAAVDVNIGTTYGTFTSGSPGYFTLLKSTPKNLVLPATGDRHEDSAANHWNYAGYFWSATPGSSAKVFLCLLAGSDVRPSSNYDATYWGFAVRCVKVNP